MERRHQVFVSSTFSDLKNERAEIMQALLELDCFPAGMELFPATSETAWELIKRVIDDSDYYCLVIGGRYGSVDAAGIGYTEKEYDYAVAQGKPAMVFLHKAPGSIATDNSEKTDIGKAKLEAFRAKVEDAYHCKYWNSADELGGQVSRSLINLRRTFPAHGWVPGEFAVDDTVILENATLKARVAQLEADLLVSSNKISIKTPDDLADGSDSYVRKICFKSEDNKKNIFERIEVTWDEILSYVGPALLGECTQEELNEKIKFCYFHAINGHENWKDIDYTYVDVPYVVEDEIMIQLRALGYMTHGIKRRAVSDQKVYWKLTEHGDARLIQVQAVKRPMKSMLAIDKLA